jgi:hypothetical protein
MKSVNYRYIIGRFLQLFPLSTLQSILLCNNSSNSNTSSDPFNALEAIYVSTHELMAAVMDEASPIHSDSASRVSDVEVSPFSTCSLIASQS